MRSWVGSVRARSAALVGLVFVACGSEPPPAAQATPASRPPATPVQVAAAPPSAEAMRGRELFFGYCISCHSTDGRGLRSLGIDLTTSRFVAAQSDPALADFLRHGRSPEALGNRTGRQMPGVATLPEIGDPEVRALVAHLRQINHPG